MYVSGWTVDQVPLSALVSVPGVVVDISARAAEDSAAKLEAGDLDAWVERHGPMPDNCLVLLRWVRARLCCNQSLKQRSTQRWRGGPDRVIFFKKKK